MVGTRIPRTNLIVDTFRGRIDGVEEDWIYFCTHAHGDHLIGLNKEGWNRGIILCSVVTKRLLSTICIGLDPKRIVGLEIGTETTFGCDENDTVSVTLIDANHCPGAVMFLFRGPFGTILHTGDFRYDNNVREDLRRQLNTERIDLAFVDNTYADSDRTLLQEAEAVSNVLSIIRRQPKGTRIYIGIFKIGKEEILIAIARALRTRIRVSRVRRKRYRLMELPDVFVCADGNDYDEEEEEASYHIEVVHSKGLTQKRLREYQKAEDESGSGRRCVGISLTGLGLRPTTTTTERKDDDDDDGANTIYTVPYSSHSSREELRSFLRDLRSREVRATSVNDLESRRRLQSLCPVIDDDRSIGSSFSSSTELGATFWYFRLLPNLLDNSKRSATTSRRIQSTTAAGLERKRRRRLRKKYKRRRLSERNLPCSEEEDEEEKKNDATSSTSACSVVNESKSQPVVRSCDFARKLLREILGPREDVHRSGI